MTVTTSGILPKGKEGINKRKETTRGMNQQKETKRKETTKRKESIFFFFFQTFESRQDAVDLLSQILDLLAKLLGIIALLARSSDLQIASLRKKKKKIKQKTTPFSFHELWWACMYQQGRQEE